MAMYCMQVLSVPTDASEQDMKRQYRKLAAQVHPDKCDLPHSEEAFKLLGKAAGHVTAAADPSRSDNIQIIQTAITVVITTTTVLIIITTVHTS